MEAVLMIKEESLRRERRELWTMRAVNQQS